MKKINLSIVIPAYNEAKNLQDGVLDEVINYLKKQSYFWEVLIVDDGSTDETVKIIEKKIFDQPQFKLIKNSHGGKAMTVISGLLKAQGEIVLFMDMDQATPIDQIEKILPKFAEGFDIIIGSRQGRKGAPIIRKLSALGFALLRNIILGLPFKDTQCGFKAFSQKSIKLIFPKLVKTWQKTKAKGSAVNAGFDVEILFLAKKLGLKTAEVPIVWHHVGTERVQIIKDAFEAILDILRIKLADFFGKY
jgi:glycosyltransferase involved in cell wall biosynthesis